MANDQLSLGEFVKVFSPVKAELFDKFGNVDELRDSYVKQAQDERNAMEAARKREEEAAAAERKRLEEFELMSSEALDRAYLEAVEAQDESRMRDLVNEAARRKGYLSTDEYGRRGSEQRQHPRQSGRTVPHEPGQEPGREHSGYQRGVGRHR